MEVQEPVKPVLVPETLWSAAMREMDPLPPRSVVEEKHVSRVDYPVEIPRALFDGVLAYLKDSFDGCDHSVGIFACGLEGIIGELELASKGEMTCRGGCGGDGYVFDEPTYRNALANLTEEERQYGPSEALGHITCPGCQGAGVVRMEVCQK